MRSKNPSPDFSGNGFSVFSVLFKAVFVRLDHLFDHLSADRTGLLGGQVAVIALLKIYADFAGRFHLKAIESLASLGNESLIALCHL